MIDVSKSVRLLAQDQKRVWPWLVVLVAALAFLALPSSTLEVARVFPDALTIPLNDWINYVSDLVLPYLKPVFRAFSSGLGSMILGIKFVLSWLPWPVISLALLAVAWRYSGWVLTLFTALTVAYIVGTGYWPQAMNTMALVIVAVFVSLILGLLLGIVAHRTKLGSKIVFPLLDVMQTVPAFAYLPILLVLFGFGPVVGMIASVIYATPPMVRNVALGLGGVSSEITEASSMAGTTRLQTLAWVELPTAFRQIRIGINQTILAAFSMVIIASVIGGLDDIGWEVLSGMRKARFGESLLSGGVIVLMAILMDRMSVGKAAKPLDLYNRVLPFTLALLVLAVALNYFLPALPEFAFGQAAAKSMNESLDAYVSTNGQALTDVKDSTFYYYMLPLRNGFVNTIFPITWGIDFTPTLRWSYGGLVAVLSLATALMFQRWRLGLIIAFFGYILYIGFTGAPWLILFAAAVLLAYQIGRMKLALFVALSLAFIAINGMWPKAMLSVYLCGAAAVISFIIGGLIGVAAASSNLVSQIVRPISDTFQTIPMFVFLIPALMFFQVGEFTALLAIIAYAFVPAIKYTEAGLRQVPEEMLEVAKEQGCTKWQTFWQVKLPLAIPSILVGLNQTILFSFAMLAIAALVGTTGLGEQVYTAVRGADVGLGVVAGLSMALLAMIADRMIQTGIKE
ncbi:MAG: ABC transporter permease [Alphaproteobacteria bacterium]